MRRLPRLEAALGDLQLELKREECSGLALGGTAARLLELALGEALAKGATSFVLPIGGTPALARQAAAACARARLRCQLVIPRDAGHDPGWTSTLLTHVFAAQVHWCKTGEQGPVDAAILSVSQQETAAGEQVYELSRERLCILAAVAGMRLLLELVDQAGPGMGEPVQLWAAMPGGYLDGIAAGIDLLGLPWRVRGPSAGVEATEAHDRAALTELVGIEFPSAPQRSPDAAAAGGLDRPVRVAVELAARTEGVLLDPAEGGRALACLIDSLRRGDVSTKHRHILINSGGPPDLVNPAALLQTA